MTILEYAPYMNGDVFTRECPPPVRCTPYMYDKVVKEAGASDTFANVIGLIDSYKEFLEVEVDVANSIPPSEREEMFYCLKNGGYSDAVPAKCIYIFKTLFAKYGSVSLALKALPQSMFTVFFQKNYLKDCTMRDVVKSLVDADYEPFTTANLRIEHTDYDEIYIIETDMVALLPKSISHVLTDQDISRITVDKCGLQVNGLYLRFMANHFGAINSTYDLRAVV